MSLPHLLQLQFAESNLSEETFNILKKQEGYVVSTIKVCDKFKINGEILLNKKLIVIQFEKKDFVSVKKILQEILALKFHFPILVVSDIQATQQISKLIKLGATDFFLCPIQPKIFLSKIKQWLDKNNLLNVNISRLRESLGLRNIIGQSEVFLSEINKIPIFAKCDACVLINGETGTGKEMFARSLHYLSHRADKPFVPINCGAIPSELVENELFGHEKGAFTGALTSQKGLIQEAHKGTLFLDEIDSLPLFSQVKLLRFLQDKEFRSLGSSKTQKADVRIIAASNADLEELAESGKFRLDLYYRLNVLQILLPPLRERLEDISLLANHFLKKYASKFNKNIFKISDSAINKLQTHSWQGNVRELENIIERAILLCESDIISTSDIKIRSKSREKIQDTFQNAKAKVIETFEKSYLQKILSNYQGNISQAAKASGKNRRAFFELIRKYEINVEKFRLQK